MGLEHFITECRNTNKRLIKQELIGLYTQKYPVLQEMLAYCYEPFQIYNIRTKGMKVPPPGNETAVEVWDDFKVILDIMETQFSAAKNKKMLYSLLERCNEETQELFLGIAGKNLKAGFSAKIVNLVLPNLVNVFDVALAYMYKPKVQYTTKIWKASKKLDGMRMVIFYKGGEWRAFTRTGKEITSHVSHLFPSCEQARQKWGYTFLDGEGYAHGVAASVIAGSILGDKDCSFIDLQVFAMGTDASKFLRGDATGIIFPNDEVRCGRIVFLSHVDVPNDFDRILAFARRMENRGYEGCMLRNPDIPYVLGRSNQLLKVKTWLLDPEKKKEDTLTVICTKINVSEQWRTSKKDGKMVKVLTLESLGFDAPDGCEGKVGSGFTYEQRDEIYVNRERYLQEKFDLLFQQKGNKGGKIFPVFVRWREDL